MWQIPSSFREILYEPNNLYKTSSKPDNCHCTFIRPLTRKNNNNKRITLSIK